jgi:hypothetical protein
MTTEPIQIDEQRSEPNSLAAELREYAVRLEAVVEEWMDQAQHYGMAQEVRSLARGLRRLSESTLAEQRRAAAAVRHRT